MNRSKEIWRNSAKLTFLVLLSVVCACAQDDAATRPKVEIQATYGGSDFTLDDAGGGSGHHVVGGSLRVRLAGRFSVQPEILYMRHRSDDLDYVFNLHGVFDISNPRGKYVVYAIGGGGLLHHKGGFERFDAVNRRLFRDSGNVRSIGVGGGVKIYLTKRLYIAPEFRIGVEPLVQGTINLGYVLGGRN